MLIPVDRWDPKRCHHGQYEVDGTLAQVTCAKCKEKVDPVAVLMELCGKETQYRHTLDRYNEAMQKIAERSRTTCQHCGKMTRIKGIG